MAYQGYPTIYALPDDLALSPIAARQRRAVRTGQWSWSRASPRLLNRSSRRSPPGISRRSPLRFPCGMAVTRTVPVQFSCHVVGADGRVTHHAWLADGPEDPRPAIAERVVAACAGTRAGVAYNAGFERACLRQIAGVVPALAEPLSEIAARLTPDRSSTSGDGYQVQTPLGPREAADYPVRGETSETSARARRVRVSSPSELTLPVTTP